MTDNDDLLPKKRKKGTDSIFLDIKDNDDLLTEILLRLPGKALIRFTSVSKKWCSLISSDYFRHNHTLRRPKPQPPSLLLRTIDKILLYLNHTINGENKAIPYTLPLPLAGDRQYWIRNGCNGLLLLESCMDYIDYCLPIKYYVLNPTTKQSREITLPPSDDYPHVVALTLAFDPSKSPYYKIVCVTSNSKNEYSCDPTYYQIHVYDSEFHRWELKLGPFAYPHESLFKYHGGVLWNDAVYWSSTTCYDLIKNEIKTLPCPPSHRDNDGDLQEFDGRLYHFVHHHREDISSQKEEEFTVGEWELGGDGDLQDFDGRLYHFVHHHREDISSQKEEEFTVGEWELGGDGDLQDFDGRLYHFVHHHREDISSQKEEEFTVGEWELGGDGDGDGDGCKWVLKRHLRIPPHPLHHHDYCEGLVRFMGGGEGGEGPTYCLMTHYCGGMRAYNFLEDEYEDVGFPDLSDQRSDYKWIDAKAFLFGEVLALV